LPLSIVVWRFPLSPSQGFVIVKKPGLFRPNRVKFCRSGVFRVSIGAKSQFGLQSVRPR
jgi:hypothetical protein